MTHRVTLTLYENLGDGFTVEDDTTGGQLLEFLDALVADHLGHLADIVQPEEGVAWSVAFDVDAVPEVHLPWLAQLIGVTLPDGLTEAEKRQRVRDREGWERGTRGALFAAIQAELTGTKTVFLTERDSSAYHFGVTTFLTETPSTARVIAAINRQKPAGLQYTYGTASGLPIDALVGTIDAQASTIDGLT